jgi:hypothetical protein
MKVVKYGKIEILILKGGPKHSDQLEHRVELGMGQLATFRAHVL